MSERSRRIPGRREALDAELVHLVGEDDSSPEELDVLEELSHSILANLPPNTHVVVHEDGSRVVVFDATPEEDKDEGTTPQDGNEPNQP